MTTSTRRDVLATGGAALAALAGCTSGGFDAAFRSDGTGSGDYNSKDYAGLKPAENNDSIETKEGLAAWVDGIERDGNTYTFNGGIRNEIDETMVEAEVESNLLYELPEDEPAKYNRLTQVEKDFSSIDPGEEETFSISVENNDHEGREPTHWEIDAHYFLNE